MDCDLDETWGEGDMAHWEILVADRLRYERGLISWDPCADWDRTADTRAYLDWRTRCGVVQGSDRLVYLEYCCQSRLKPLHPDDLASAMAKVAESRPVHVDIEVFRAWLKPGEYSGSGLTAAYRTFCSEHRVKPMADRLMKDRLKRLRGAWKRQEDRLVGGKRQRPVVWIIEPVAVNIAAA